MGNQTKTEDLRTVRLLPVQDELANFVEKLPEEPFDVQSCFGVECSSCDHREKRNAGYK